MAFAGVTLYGLTFEISRGPGAGGATDVPSEEVYRDIGLSQACGGSGRAFSNRWSLIEYSVVVNHIHRLHVGGGKQNLVRIQQKCRNTTSAHTNQPAVLVKFCAAFVKATNCVALWLHAFGSEVGE